MGISLLEPPLCQGNLQWHPLTSRSCFWQNLHYSHLHVIMDNSDAIKTFQLDSPYTSIS